MKSPEIKSEHYIIRPFKASDAALWQQWDVDTEVQAHMPEPANQPQSLSEHLAYIETCNAEPDGYYWSIDTLDGSTIGTVALTDINEYHKTAELGIVIGDKRYWGKGVATEVVRTLIAYAFEHLQLKRISAEAESENVGIQKVLKKAGFEEDGLFRSARIKNGARIDVRHFAIINNS